MDKKKAFKALPAGQERISPVGLPCRKWRGIAGFLIACAVFMAVFAVASICMRAKGGDWGGSFPWIGNDGTTSGNRTRETLQSSLPATEGENEAQGEGIRIVENDLSYPDLGRDYLHNETPYTPSVESLLERPLILLEKDREGPVVLILHTHTSEAYLEESQSSFEHSIGDLTYSRAEERSVIAVGKVLCETLNQKGVTALHCTVTHDEPTLSGSYERAASTVRRYLEMYPSILYVIDLHRDAVLTGKGEYVRPLTPDAEVPTAQIMAVVGSDCNDPNHGEWEENLALALQLRERLNTELPSVCRPISLRKATYNQELAPRFLLLEIGSGANTVEEGKEAARLLGEVLAELLQSR